jgi:hypothetical protein
MRMEDKGSQKMIYRLLALALACILIGMCGYARADTFNYPVVCSDADGKVLLVADGDKVRVAQWDKRNNKPRFTDSRPTSRHQRVFDAPRGSVCRIER